MLNKLTPNLMVEDVARTLEFYRDVLGFQVLVTVPPEGDTFGWAMVSRDKIELMFQSRESIREDLPFLADALIGASQTFYIEVKGIQELYDAVKGKVELVHDMRTTFYGTKEFYFRDLNGYILCFSEGEAQE